MKRPDWSNWSKLPGRPQEVWLSSSGEVVVLGVPRDRDGNDIEHNCDANGCGMDHVLWRGRVGSKERGE